MSETITTRELEQIALKTETEDLKNFLENAPMPMHWVNGSGIIIWVNKAELDLLGYEKEEVINKHINAFHLDQDVIDDMMSRLINKETLKNYPARLKCKNGGIKNVLVNSNVFWKNDTFV